MRPLTACSWNTKLYKRGAETKFSIADYHGTGTYHIDVPHRPSLVVDLMATVPEPLHNAFSRHPRPQLVNVPMVPTKAALARRRLSPASSDAYSLPKSLPSLPTMTVMQESSVVETVKQSSAERAPSVVPLTRRPPWAELKHVGTLIQAGRHIDLCVERHKHGGIVMLRRLARTDMSSHAQLHHPNICHVRRVFDTGEHICLESDYFRFMLEEILVVSLPLEVPQLRQIAISVS